MTLLKVLKWSSIAALLLALALGAYMWWVVASFDTRTLPANHGQVAVELYAGDASDAGDKRPLLVGLGGAEGGNAWARPVWKQQRDRFLEQGYAVQIGRAHV